MSEASTRSLIDDLRAVVSEAEALIEASIGDASDRAAKVRERAEHSVGKARAHLEDLEHEFRSRAKVASEDAATYVRENPLQAIGIAAAVGVIIGLMVGRR
jgi:ElaB/YqjD/DUF883 family membrane-anchored ribosome-binding protein